MYFSKQCFVLVLICHCAVPWFAEDCVEFEVNNDELVVQENTTLTLNFTLSNTCKNASSMKLVKVWNGSHSLCVIEQRHGSCVPPSHHPNCTCNATTQQYSVRHFITGKQSRQWTLVAEQISVKSTKRPVNITVEYPPEISKLTFESNGKEINKTAPAMLNSTINILCVWEEGNPPQLVTLKKDGVELSSKVSVQQNHLSVTEHVIHNVQCSDTGLIRCEAPGARENKTQLLYVKCEPLIADGEFSFPASSGQQTLELPVTAYHHHVVTCQLWRYKATENVPSSLPVDCTRQALLTGSVPNLTLTIQLPEGTSQMVGRWRLDLRNRDEHGSVYFTIENNSPEPSRVLIGAVIVPIVVIVVVVIVVIVVWRQRLIHKVTKVGRDKQGNRRDRLAVSQSFYRRSNVSVMITNDLYEGCDTTRTPVGLDYTDVHDAIQQSRGGTPGSTAIDTRDNTIAMVAAGVSLQAGAGTELAGINEVDDNGDYEEISPRQPTVPTRNQQHVHQQLPPTTLTPPKPCHSSEVTGDYADVE